MMIFCDKIKTLLLACSALLFVSYGTPAFSREYYVSPGGNDSGSGTYALPFKTIAKASSSVIPGDKVIIRAGTYRERVKPGQSGRVGRYIVYAAYPNEKVTIDGTNVPVHYWGGLVDLSNRDYIKINGLTVINSAYTGIFGHQANNILVSNCHTYNTASSGIGMHYSNNIVISKNEVALANTTSDQENITIESVANFEVRYNHLHDGGKSTTGGEGIDAKGNSSNGKIYGNKVHGLNREGIYVDAYSGWLYNVQVYNNRVYSNAVSGIGIGNEAGGYLHDVYVYNNIVYQNQWSGIIVSGGSKSNVYLISTNIQGAATKLQSVEKLWRRRGVNGAAWFANYPAD